MALSTVSSLRMQATSAYLFRLTGRDKPDNKTALIAGLNWMAVITAI